MAARRSDWSARSCACLTKRDVVADAENRRAVLVVGQVARVPDDPAARAVAADDRVFEAAAGTAGDDAREFVGDSAAVGSGKSSVR